MLIGMRTEFVVKEEKGGIAKQMQEKRGNPCLSAGNKLSLLQL